MSFEISNTQENVIARQNSLVRKVYLWMCAALVITGLVSLAVVSSPQFLNLIFGNSFIFFGLIIAELIVVGVMVARIMRMSMQTALLSFFAYAILNGLTLSVIFLAYTTSSIVSTFMICAATFGIMSFMGYTTKQDLTSMGQLLKMLLIGIIVAMLVNIFMKSEMMDWIISIIGIIIFTGLTAYNAQKIKQLAQQEQTEEVRKLAILGALTIYLDFINLFLYLLRFLGNRR